MILLDKEYGKKILILDIMKILHKFTDENNRINQKDIKDILEKEYNLKVDRKTVKRNLEDLIEYGERNDANEILYHTNIRKVSNRVTNKKEKVKVLSEFGFLHDFSQGELRLIIDSILFCHYIPISQREELIEKLEGLQSKYFNSKINYIQTMSDKELKNNDLFFNIEILDEAISKFKQISFNYNKYRLDKNSQLCLGPQLNKDGKVRQYIVNPYQMAVSNGRYYLICNHNKYDNLSHYRLDRITNISLLDRGQKPMKEVKGLEKGLNLPKHMVEHIYMYTGESDSVLLRIKKYLLNEFIDWFGTENASFFDQTEDEVTAKVTVNRIDMRKWALQYALHTKVLSPKSLVDEIRGDIEKAMENYK